MLSDGSFSVLPPHIKMRCWQGVIHVTDGPEYFPYAFKKKLNLLFTEEVLAQQFFFFF